MTTSTSKNPLTPILVQFERYNRLKYQERDQIFVMTLTKKAKDGNKLYFGCINRHLEHSNPNKCNATGHYDQKSKEYTAKRPHSMGCGVETNRKFAMDDSYDTQKELLLKELTNNHTLTTVSAQTFLTKENSRRPDEKKFKPLSYEQVKYIIERFRADNGINSTESLQNAMVLTSDNSLFLRYNSSFYGSHKGNYYFENKLL
jgi:hypothetical protein